MMILLRNPAGAVSRLAGKLFASVADALPKVS